MGHIKCASCGNLFDTKKESKSVKVTLSNPGDVFCEGKVSTCPHCNEQHVEDEDMLDLAESFDKAHSEKYSNFKKKIIA